MIGGLEVTGVTYPGVPPHSKPQSATHSLTAPLHLASHQAKLCQTRRKEILWLENADGMSVKPQKTKGLTKKVKYDSKTLNINNTIQDIINLCHGASSEVGGRGKTAMIPYLWWRSICSEYKWGIKWKSWLN